MEATVQDQGDEIIKYTFIVQLDLFFFLLFPKEGCDVFLLHWMNPHSVGAGGPPKTAGGHEGGPATERLDKIQNLRVPPGLAEGGLQLLHGRDVQAEVAGSLKGGEAFWPFVSRIEAKFSCFTLVSLFLFFFADRFVSFELWPSW